MSCVSPLLTSTAVISPPSHLHSFPHDALPISSSVDDPYEPGYRFDGWYTSESFVSWFYFEDYAGNPDRSDISVYAKMTKLGGSRSEEHTSELQSRFDLVCRLLLEKKNEYYLHT